jgi:hypothetical protein
VASVFKAHEGGTVEEAERRYSNAINTLVSATYSGARKDSDWWVLRRRYDPDVKGAYTDLYTAYVLYTIPKKALDEQIVNEIDKIRDGYPELASAFDAITADILQRGLEWED